MKKRIFYTELAYVFGLIFLALGTALMEQANLGMSMIVAPAYILHLKISQVLPFFSFGMAEYTLQAVIILLMILLLRRFRLSYLFSFITAVIYGFTLDGVMLLTAMIPNGSMAVRILLFIIGMIVCALGVSLMFHTYISPEAYELFVKEVSLKFGWEIHKFKTVYDCASCAISVILSFAFFGMWHFEGVKLGTIFCALVNGAVIGLCTKLLEKNFNFRDGLALRKYF